MALVLDSNNYLHGLKWRIKPKNVIDTVNSSTYIGAVEDRVITTFTITEGMIDGQQKELPLADSDESSSVSNDVYNIRSGTVEACGSLRMSLLKGTYTIHLTSPVVGNLRVRYVPTGTTVYTDENKNRPVPGQVYDAAIVNKLYSRLSLFADKTSSMEGGKSYDKTTRALFKDGLLVDYTQPTITAVPWVRNTPTDYRGSMSNYTQRQRPDTADVYCWWYDLAFELILARYNEWNTSNDINRRKQGPDFWPQDPSKVSEDILQNSFIPLLPYAAQVATEVEKIDELTYKVNYSVPVRYLQWCSVFTRRLKPQQRSYGWIDKISAATFEVVATDYDYTTSNYSYSLDSSGVLTADAKNKYPVKFDANELLTNDVTWEEDSWVTKMSSYLLTKFKNGKYIISCDVRAAWVLQNDVHVNDEVNVKLLDGSFITSRSSTTTKLTFQVKNIEKVFNESEFYYTIQLMEV